MSDWRSRAIPVAADWKERATPVEQPYDYAAHTGMIAPVRKVPAGEGWFGSQYEPAVPKMISEGVPALIEDISAPADLLRGKEMTPDEMNSHARGIVGAVVGSPGVEAVASRALRAAAPVAKDVAETIAAAKSMPPVEPTKTIAQWRTASQDFYKAAEDAGISVAPDEIKNLSQNVINDLDVEGFDPASFTPKLRSAVNRLKIAAKADKPRTFKQMETLRRAVRNGIKDPAASDDEMRLGYQIIGKIDDVIDKTGAGEHAVNARAAWARMSRMEDIQDTLDIAKRLGDKGPAYIQQQFNKILKDTNKFDRYTPDQKELISKIANTGFVEGGGRMLAPTKDWAGALKAFVGITLGAGAGLGLGGIAVPIMATGVKAMGNVARRSNVKVLQESISRGGRSPGRIERIRAERARRAMETAFDTP